MADRMLLPFEYDAPPRRDVPVFRGSAAARAVRPPRGARTSCTRGSTTGGTHRGCTRDTTGTYVPPRYGGSTRYTAARREDVPLEASYSVDVQHRPRPPGRYRRAPVLPRGSQGRVPRRGLPAPASRYRRGRGAIAMTYFSSPPLSPRDPRYAIPAGARPRTGQSYVPAGDVPGAPPAVLGDGSPGTRPRRRSGSRSPPRRGAPGERVRDVPEPFPPGRRREQPPVRPREQGVRGPYRYEFAG